MPKERDWYVDEDDPQWARQWVDGKWAPGRVHLSRLIGTYVHGRPDGPSTETEAFAQPRRSNRERNYRIIAVVLASGTVVALVLGAIALHNNGVRAEAEEAAASKAAATETPAVSEIDYATATCGDWTDTFDDAQRYTMAADILTVLRQKQDGYSGLPERSLVIAYEEEIGRSCAAGPTVIASQAASLVYLTDARFGHR